MFRLRVTFGLYGYRGAKHATCLRCLYQTYQHLSVVFETLLFVLTIRAMFVQGQRQSLTSLSLLLYRDGTSLAALSPRQRFDGCSHIGMLYFIAVTCASSSCKARSFLRSSHLPQFAPSSPSWFGHLPAQISWVSHDSGSSCSMGVLPAC